MSSIILKCSGCGAVLEVSDSNVDSMGDIVIHVKTCPDLGCCDCSDCEDNKLLKKVREILHECI